MNVSVEAPAALSKAMHRVADALKLYKPDGVRIVKAGAADVVFLHTIGTDAIEFAERVQRRGRQYAVLQYCFRSTQSADCSVWEKFWNAARCVYSYYDLNAEMLAQGYDPLTNFVFAPLGADEKVFYPTQAQKKFIAACSGYVDESECLSEVVNAANSGGLRVFHLGPREAVSGSNVRHLNEISDASLAAMYSVSKYVTGLRRGEGFELPLVEGLLCGARPITFDLQCYRQWYGDFAEYVISDKPEDVERELRGIFFGPYRQVTEEERERAIKRFSWKSFAEKVWTQVLA